MQYQIKKQKTVVEVIVSQFICRFGTLLQILTVQETNLTSSLFKEVCDFLLIDEVQTSSVRLQGSFVLNRVI